MPRSSRCCSRSRRPAPACSSTSGTSRSAPTAVPFGRRDAAGREFYRVEAAGVRWHGEAADGVPEAEVLDVTATSITLRRYPVVTPSRGDARAFGRQLALTHAAGAPHHGAAPPGVRDG